MEGTAQDLAAIVGRAHVAEDASTRDTYARDESFAPAMQPRAVVRPGSAEEVERLVAWANETLTPLVPVSSGPPHVHGDTVPGVAGAVIVDLTRMDRILRIDRRNRVCVIEPGVSWAEIQPALAAHGMRITPPLAPRATKSVIACLLEREPTLIPRYNYQLPEPLRDCGVVWGGGEVTYTGEAGGWSLSLDEQWRAGVVQAEPKGPAQTDFFRLLTGAQGSMGIVTWASVRCELLPSARALRFIAGASLDELLPVLRAILRVRLGDEVFVVDAACLERLLGAAADPVARQDLPAWSIVVGLGGREKFAAERVTVQDADLAALASHNGVTVAAALPGVADGALEDVLDRVAARPWRPAAKGGSADVFFLTTLDRAPGFVAAAREVAGTLGFPPGDLGVYIQPQHQGVSHHVELSLPFHPEDADEAGRARRFHDEAAARLIGDGAYFSRPYGSWAAPVYARDPASTAALRKVKRIFDPNGIMNPGKLCFPAFVGKEA